MTETGLEVQGSVEEAKRILREGGPVVVAFSGGVDSSVVLALAVGELGADKVVAVTACSETYTESELHLARRVAQGLGVRHVELVTEELSIPGFADNPPDRCYYCKGELFDKLWGVARAEGFGAVVDGANRDDLGDTRPGLRAADEAGVGHPLLAAGLGKVAVRALAKELELPNWDLPAMACLSSRFPYGEPITVEKLRMVSRAEDRVRRLGVQQVRVRHHEAGSPGSTPSALARIEVGPDDVAVLASEGVRAALVQELRAIGYTYVTLDLAGFRSGSMNEVLASSSTTGLESMISGGR